MNVLAATAIFRTRAWYRFSRNPLSLTGAAIRGPARVDLYFGSGDEAGEQAGYMKSAGRLYLLLKREAALN